MLPVLLFALAGNVEAQISFKNKNTKLITSNFHSGCSVTIADWNFDGLDDIIRLDDGRIAHIEVQRTNATFQNIPIGTFSTSSGWAWGMVAVDLDHNGYLDIIAGSSGPALRIFMTDANGAMGSMISLPNSGYFVQNITAGDFNNDGWIDLFVCDDNAQSHIYLNDGAGGLTESFTTMNFDVTSTDDSGNYGSVWTDFDNDGDLDLYIAKCRQNVNSPTDGRRINVLFVNDGNNNFTEAAATYGINVGWQSWTSSFGDIDNDADLDLLITNHDHESQIWENDGTGHYTDITATTGFDITDITPIESAFEDFDNDGYVDMIITGTNSRFYRNNGDKTFTKIEGLFNSNRMESFAIGDLNHDGKVDIYGGYATIYTNPTSVDDVIWMNSSNNNNHFVTINLIGTVSNKGAIGARATLYSSLGAQLREVRAGENYGTCNSSMLHFGMGSVTTIDSIVVRFPSGITQTILNPVVDQFIKIIENDCISPAPIVTYSQTAPFICTGSTETLTATSGLNYLWSDNSTTQSISITAGGEFNVMVSTAGNNCIGLSPTLVIEQDPDQTPTISAIGETEFCDGATVDIVAPAGLNSYLWSDGSTTQNISATVSGTYYLTVQGYCAQFMSADSINVTAHIIPLPVTNTTVTIPAAGATTLTATGTNINWYDDATGTSLVGTGPSFLTPVISGLTNFWVENTETFNAGIFSVGRFSHTGTSLYSGSNSTNATVYFDVEKACTLLSVKVYTDSAFTRRIELRDNQNTLLQYADVLISPDTQIVNLNFALTPGTGYRLVTNDSVNNANWGNVGPRLKRTSTGSVYPYTINDALSITGNDFGSQYFYYYYDWNVEKPGFTCNSGLVPVSVEVVVGLPSIQTSGISMYPNPTGGILNIKLEKSNSTQINIYDATGRLVMKQSIQEMNSTLSVQSLPTGVYQVEFIQSGSSFQQKLVKL
ncbi:MAG: VCBS repeat-containing protein [Bacteroidetes bacterium]|nr:VCBS repeat-containing protein [Bacteroidota bacterium]